MKSTKFSCFYKLTYQKEKLWKKICYKCMKKNKISRNQFNQGVRSINCKILMKKE